jgi:hypothetical protein
MGCLTRRGIARQVALRGYDLRWRRFAPVSSLPGISSSEPVALATTAPNWRHVY